MIALRTEPTGRVLVACSCGRSCTATPARSLSPAPAPARASTSGATGLRLVVCPALRSSAVTCNDCRLCDPLHPVWTRERGTPLAGVAFPEHGRSATAAARRQGRALPNVGAQRPWLGTQREVVSC